MLPTYLRPFPEQKSPLHELRDLNRLRRSRAGNQGMIAGVESQGFRAVPLKLEHRPGRAEDGSVYATHVASIAQI